MSDRPGQSLLADSSLANSLPPTFLYGAASASHQIEGCIEVDGKGLNVWDVAMADRKGDNGEDACNSYEQWREDIALIKKYGMKCYRFSISWARIIPKGGRNDPVNEKGIQYYSTLIDALIAEGIEPVVTIFHWDHPQALEDNYGSFANTSEIVEDFVNYSRICFESFGDRVTKWITLNEPHIFTMQSSMSYKKSFNWNTDVTKFARTLLLCHARAVELYRRDFQPKSKGGQIGIALDCDWTEPINDSPEANKAQQIYLDIVLGLYADPIYIGEYSDGLKEEYGSQLPSFSAEEAALLRGSSDFFGLNHYGTSYSTGKRISPEEAGNQFRVWAFGRTEKVFEKDGVLIGTRGQNGHPHDVPWGFRKLLNYISKRYTKPNGVSIWITENGMGVENEATFTREQQIHDVTRQKYYAGYVESLVRAVKEDGVDIGAYMAWSLLDNLEWMHGYFPRFGITVVDRANGFKREPKDSAYLLKDMFAHLISK